MVTLSHANLIFNTIQYQMVTYDKPNTILKYISFHLPKHPINNVDEHMHIIGNVIFYEKCNMSSLSKHINTQTCKFYDIVSAFCAHE